jgi:hypothetical protein
LLKSKQGTYLNIIFQELFLKFDQEQCEFELRGNRGKSNTHTSIQVFTASDTNGIKNTSNCTSDFCTTLLSGQLEARMKKTNETIEKFLET